MAGHHGGLDRGISCITRGTASGAAAEQPSDPGRAWRTRPGSGAGRIRCAHRTSPLSSGGCAAKFGEPDGAVPEVGRAEVEEPVRVDRARLDHHDAGRVDEAPVVVGYLAEVARDVVLPAGVAQLAVVAAEAPVDEVEVFTFRICFEQRGFGGGGLAAGLAGGGQECGEAGEQAGVAGPARGQARNLGLPLLARAS